jgi:hypothetical protein
VLTASVLQRGCGLGLAVAAEMRLTIPSAMMRDDDKWLVPLSDRERATMVCGKTTTKSRSLVQPSNLVFVDACRVFGISGLRERLVDPSLYE